MGIARLGGVASNGSGDIFIAFSTANAGAAAETGETALTWLPNGDLTPYFEATVQATEEAIVNALVAAETMVGINGKHGAGAADGPAAPGAREVQPPRPVARRRRSRVQFGCS
jgi:L-aminopeptidase/D-esterase-like protein